VQRGGLAPQLSERCLGPPGGEKRMATSGDRGEDRRGGGEWRQSLPGEGWGSDGRRRGGREPLYRRWGAEVGAQWRLATELRLNGGSSLT
jgi:hypothetical protein